MNELAKARCLSYPFDLYQIKKRAFEKALFFHMHYKINSSSYSFPKYPLRILLGTSIILLYQITLYSCSASSDNLQYNSNNGDNKQNVDYTSDMKCKIA